MKDYRDLMNLNPTLQKLFEKKMSLEDKKMHAVHQARIY